MDSGGAFVSTITQRRVIEWDEGWGYIQSGIKKLLKSLDEFSKPHFSTEEQVMMYTTVYNMCTQMRGSDYSQRLYIKHHQTFQQYITSTVLPALTDKRGESLLRELVRQWTNQKVMVRWLSSFFWYLECYFIPKAPLPPLKAVAHTAFCNMVYREVRANTIVAVTGLVNKDREGDEEIDRELLKSVIDMLVEIKIGEVRSAYEEDFEPRMLGDTSEYYVRKASSWIAEDSFPEYMLKAEECLRRERDRVSHYLQSSSAENVLEKAQRELLVVNASELLGNEHSGFRALLRDGEVEHLSRMYRLYHDIPGCLELIASLFKQYVIIEGLALVHQQAEEDDARNKISELRDKYTAYADDCFMKHSLFQHAMEEAFEVLSNKSVPGNVELVLLDAPWENILEHALAEAFERVVYLLP